LLGEKLARVALAAAERSSEISARWAKDSLTRMGELATVKDEPSDYAKAASDFASASAELAAEYMAAYAEVAKKVQMDTGRGRAASGVQFSCLLNNSILSVDG
ncbi:phasin family protein, partial [Paracoccus sp. (in: a-proteobacteria)]|uniref:phasin family protein n=1 Tax=Paracoccus sp. TaxID=267 RepID=UPI00396CD50C